MVGNAFRCALRAGVWGALVVAASLVFAGSASAGRPDFSLVTKTGGKPVAKVSGDIVFDSERRAFVSLTLKDLAYDGWCPAVEIQVNKSSDRYEASYCDPTGTYGKSRKYKLVLSDRNLEDVKFIGERHYCLDIWVPGGHDSYDCGWDDVGKRLQYRGQSKRFYNPFLIEAELGPGVSAGLGPG